MSGSSSLTAYNYNPATRLLAISGFSCDNSKSNYIYLSVTNPNTTQPSDQFSFQMYNLNNQLVQTYKGSLIQFTSVPNSLLQV